MVPPGEQFGSVGRVFLVGAGPGDPELLTVKARRLLGEADVVVHDHLVSPEILAWINPAAEILFVGKKGGSFCKPQSEIDDLLVRLGRERQTVVRLKGGDPFIFGRGGEEAEALVAAGIPFEVVPGVTSALAAAAYSGIPLTHRAHSSGVILLTGHEDPAKPNATVKWEEAARTGLTLCIYMGVKNLPTISRRLAAGGLSADTPAAVIQAATTGSHRRVLATLATISDRAAQEQIEAPAIVIIGDVARFAETLNWFDPAQVAHFAQ
jgi:uroporphyrinogen III methyltransferase/synthase